MGAGILQVGILIGPETTFVIFQERPDSIQSSDEELAGGRIGFGNNVDLRSIRGKQIQMLLGCFSVDDTNQLQFVISARLCQSDGHVS